MQTPRLTILVLIGFDFDSFGFRTPAYLNAYAKGLQQGMGSRVTPAFTKELGILKLGSLSFLN